jgi:hypothetical protein
MPRSKIVALALAVSLVAGLVPFAAGQTPPQPQPPSQGQEPGPESGGRTPPRLSFVDGQVSYFRPGAQEWAQAQVNIPLAAGDELYTGSPGNLELQVGSRAYVRAWANSQLGLTNHEPDFVQFKVTAGHVSFDIRTIEPGRTVEIDTPNAAFTIEQAGYYRVDVSADQTSFITRRGGRAMVTPASGQSAAVSPSEEVVVESGENPRVASYVAPQLDEWDRWNYARTDALVEAVSARYVSSDVYGVRDLDRYGAWRVVPTYGSVWVPAGVPATWAPYSTGSWTLDPIYGWTWVDTAPWGWAPYHYGRWVYVNGFWAWAPGPVVVRPVYAPALVAFYRAPGVSVTVTSGGPLVGWVALGWGEPCVPWWGPVGFARVPWWGGWGGPRVVNNVVINKTTVVNVQNITVYQNSTVHNAVVTVTEQRFGRGPVAGARTVASNPGRLELLHTPPQVAVTPASYEPTSNRGIKPPEQALNRQVVATRPPRPWSEPGAKVETPGAKETAKAGMTGPAPRLVAPPERGSSVASPRPPFGPGKVERQSVDRPHAPAPPKFEPGVGGAPTTQPRASTNPRREEPGAAQPAPESGRQPRPPKTPEVSGQPRPVPQSPEVSSQPRSAPQPPEAGQQRTAPQAPGAGVPRKSAPEARPQPTAPGVPAPAPQPAPQQREPRASAPPPGRALPGEPANRLAPTHSPGQSAKSEGKAGQGAPGHAGQAGPPAGGGNAGREGPRQ